MPEQFYSRGKKKLTHTDEFILPLMTHGDTAMVCRVSCTRLNYFVCLEPTSPNLIYLEVEVNPQMLCSHFLE